MKAEFVKASNHFNKPCIRASTGIAEFRKLFQEVLVDLERRKAMFL